MDQKSCDESAKNASNLNSAKTIHEAGEPIACPTQQKTSELLPSKSNEPQIQLPEKYRAIADLFTHMSCSLRLLHLRKKSPTFQNVSTQVEILAQRKFSYAHLAQMKYIFPEGIYIDKVVVHDKKSLCMKPDMKITLVFDVVEEHFEDESADLALWRYFSSRLLDFFKVHPEATDIPEAVLPEPFCQRACSLISVDLPVNSSTALFSTSNQIEPLPQRFHLYPSFNKHFSQKIVASQTERLQCLSSTKTSLSSCTSDCLDDQESENRWQEGCAPLSDCVINLNTERGQQKESSSMDIQPSVVNTPVHMVCPPHSDRGTNFESPDIKIFYSPNSLMREKPAQSEAGKLMPISDAKLQYMDTQKPTSSHKPAKRVLDFSLMEDNDGFDIRVDKLESCRGSHELDSIRESSSGCAKDCNSSGSVLLPQEVEESFGHSLENANQMRVGLNTSDKKSSSLLGLVNVIHSIFQSVRRTPITKEELVQKIIMNSLDFVEIREVEEQVGFLEKLVPDWICKKLLPSGDIMYCIKKVSDLDSVRSRLSGNVTMGGALLSEGFCWTSGLAYS